MVCNLGMESSFPADFTTFFYDFWNIFQSLMVLELEVISLRYFP